MSMQTPAGLAPKAGHDTGDLQDRIAALEAAVEELQERVPDARRVTILVFSGKQDKVLAALLIGTTAAAMGMDVTLFFTFWGINVLKERRAYAGKDLRERMIDFVTPTGATHMGVSQLNLLGAGSRMLQRMMKDKHIVSAQTLLQQAREAGVRLVACSMTMEVMGIRREELVSGIEVAGAASYLVEASRSGCTLFV
ncbi:MAG: hypothetical protein D6721_05945 [Gammaproteobacteria bacterium]|nr:MAG: hypothetical protein D6721_05945 [Gammaproteobacteria bacterium]